MFFRKQSFADSCILLLLFVCGVGLLFWSEAVSAAITQTVRLCIQVLLPSLFPFFVLSSLLISSGIVQRTAPRVEWVTRWLFDLPGSCTAAILLGAVGGYPVGAKTISALYAQGSCDKEDALHALRFCNNAGPAFLISAVGAGLLNNKNHGILLYGLHLISALFLGLIFHNNKRSVKLNSITQHKTIQSTLSNSFLQSITDSFFSFLNVCAFVIFFAVILCFLEQLPLLKRLASLPRGLIYGLLELTSGVAALASANLSARIRLTALSFLCGFGGLSVQLQTLRFLTEADLPCRDYLTFKLLHGVLAALLTFLLYR